MLGFRFSINYQSGFLHLEIQNLKFVGYMMAVGVDYLLSS
jgi:hypothetical protein